MKGDGLCGVGWGWWLMNIEAWLVEGKAEKRQGYTAERGWLLDELNGGGWLMAGGGAGAAYNGSPCGANQETASTPRARN